MAATALAMICSRDSAVDVPTMVPAAIAIVSWGFISGRSIRLLETGKTLSISRGGSGAGGGWILTLLDPAILPPTPHEKAPGALQALGASLGHRWRSGCFPAAPYPPHDGGDLLPFALRVTNYFRSRLRPDLEGFEAVAFVVVVVDPRWVLRFHLYGVCHVWGDVGQCYCDFDDRW